MLTTNDFDTAATIYDTTFTYTRIGKLQRNRVYYYIKKSLKKIGNPKQSKILEVNCGTGEDAIWFSKQGYDVLATDISLKMLEKAAAKAGSSHGISFKQADVAHLDESIFEHQFDMIFSNFGGLNCIDTSNLKHFFHTTDLILKENGTLALVLMPKKCLWERCYFGSKGDFKKAFRRNTSTSVSAHVDGTIVPTWYYNPKQIIEMTKGKYIVEMVKPIGFMIPPSYLEPFFKNKGRILSFLGWLDQKLTYFSWLSPYADHFIIILKKK